MTSAPYIFLRHDIAIEMVLISKYYLEISDQYIACILECQVW